MQINGKTRLCGLIGNPVEHTQSPAIHNTLAEIMDLNMAYVPFLVEKDGLESALKGAYDLNILGLNVTVPYKNDVIPYLVDIDIMAKNIGAVNTLVRTQGGYKGYNTDITGLWRAMTSDGVNIAGEEVVILGAGGVGRAVTFMCASSGAKKVYLLNRDSDKAAMVAEEVNGKLGTKCVVSMPLYDYVKFSTKKAERKYIVVQATSVGLYPNVEDVVIGDYEFYKCIKAGYDLIYNPWETMFVQLVKANGGKAYNGLKMLLYQGIDAFELWNNCSVSDESASIIYKQLKGNIRK